jgi:fibro-slime domain-containing protein
MGLALLAACTSPEVRGPMQDPGAPARPAPGGEPEGDAGFSLPATAGDAAAVPARACGKLVATIRDFRTDHPDFEKDALNIGIVWRGIVRPELGADRKPIYASPGRAPSTTGREGFDQWYRDVPGVNLRFEVPLALAEERPGVFAYDDQAFFPLDGRGFTGDDRFGHNFAFTTEIHTTFKYKGGERFSFTGDDDVFVFVNGRLALDLGGVHATASEVIDFDARRDTLGLAVGGNYPLDVFHAERHTKASTFRIETSIDCLTVYIP